MVRKRDEARGVWNGATAKPFRVAIIGGGPGGLFAAWHLGAKAGLSCHITVFEASNRLGGKVQTSQFAGIVPYEAGAAEIYDYSRLGPDPLHDLIVHDLGLEIKYIAGGPCVLDGKILLDAQDLVKPFGVRARDEALAFRKRCGDLLSPKGYYFSVAEEDNVHPWARVSGDELLKREFTDDAARRYIRAMAHSDVSAAPHMTNGLTYLKNVLMDVGGYMDIFAVVGGNEQIMTRLADQLDAEIRLNADVTAVEPLPDGRYRLEVRQNGFEEQVVMDYVVVALPLTALSTIHWRSESLEIAMDKHVGHFDHLGHYLRATFLFRRPFWRSHISSDWWMLDAFDGCCVYDEGTRYDYGGFGLLAFLIAGNAALELANVSDDRIEQMCLDALPEELAQAKELLLDRRVHRWVATVSAIPGGFPVRPRRINHRPDPIHSPGLVMVGDYMFDATINGVMDSAEAATDIILADVVTRRRAQPAGGATDDPSSPEAMNLVLQRIVGLMCTPSIVHILKTAFGLEHGAKILHLGSGAGNLVATLRALGFDAMGVECSREASRATTRELAQHNVWCDFSHLPFEDGRFDAVIDTGLYRTAPNSVDAVIAELRRVTKGGVLLGSVTTDLTVDLIERMNLLEGVRVLCSRWDWAERFYAAGFAHALFDSLRLGEAWEKARAPDGEPSQWYEDSESLLYCVYEPGPRPVAPILKRAPEAEAKADEPDLVAII